MHFFLTKNLGPDKDKTGHIESSAGMPPKMAATRSNLKKPTIP
jgi:hypothetical protein